MSIGYRVTSGSSRYFWVVVSICVFIGYAAVQVATRIAYETATASASAPARSTTHATTPPPSIYVIDGDTVSLNDGKPNVCLVGFNAPETGSQARCEIERQTGEAAKQRLRELVSKGRPDFQQVACSCLPGTEGTKACNFGRRCGTLRMNGVDVGSTLIGEGLAVRYACGASSCPTLPRPWC
jgi:endonuclease YncB( thermonuclease family)